MYYLILVAALKEARQLGFKTEIVSNAYWATSVEDALEWLRPIVHIGIDDVSLSSDGYHADRVDSEECNKSR